MADPIRDEEQPSPETPRVAAIVVPVEPLDDEEKILAGRADVNMPALLTKDVQGG